MQRWKEGKTFSGGKLKAPLKFEVLNWKEQALRKISLWFWRRESREQKKININI